MPRRRGPDASPGDRRADTESCRKESAAFSHRRKKAGLARRRLGNLFMIAGSLMLFAAVALLAYNQWDDWRAGNAVVQIQEALDVAMEERNVTLSLYLAINGTEAEEEADAEEMAAVEVDGYDYIGTLSISRYGLELPVMAEWSYPGLKIAPGRYSGSVESNDLVICGHNYERHFGYLKDLDEGDEITFTDVDGNIYYYVVEEVLTLQPTDIEEMLSEGGISWDLTLFTCTVGGQARVTVRCSQVAVVKK